MTRIISMNKRVWTYGIFILTWIASACSSNSVPAPTSSLTTNPEADLAENDKSGGIYKGTIVGSSGVFVVRLQKGVKEIAITLDGVTKKLVPTGLTTWTTGDPIKNAVFALDGWEAVFSVGATGLLPQLTVNIPGHTNAQVVVLKELSTSIIRVYEGTYTGTSAGTWNFVIQGPALIGVSRSTDGSTVQSFEGLVDGTTVTFTSISGTGSLSGDNASGTWATTSPTASGSWTGKRIL